MLTLLAGCAIALALVRSIFAAVMLTGIYSLLSAAIFMVMDAVDVAFTEAAVGAGLTTVLMLGALSLIGTSSRSHRQGFVLPLVVVSITGIILLTATVDMPHYGNPEGAIHKHVAPEYLKGTVRETAAGHTSPDHSAHEDASGEHAEGHGHEVGPPNVVTSVLGSYRGFDTLGETTVVLTAATAVLLILGQSRSPKQKPGSDESETAAEDSA